MLYFSNNDGCYICKDEMNTVTAEKGYNTYKYLSYRKYETLGVATEIELTIPKKMIGNYSNSGTIATVEACWEFVNMMKLCDKTKAFGFESNSKNCGCVPTGEQV